MFSDVKLYAMVRVSVPSVKLRSENAHSENARGAILYKNINLNQMLTLNIAKYNPTQNNPT